MIKAPLFELWGLGLAGMLLRLYAERETSGSSGL